MSRSTLTKSRIEKGKSSATPAVAHEIIPGKLNEQEWNWLLEYDVGNEFVLDIVEDVCSSALDIIYEKYIERQLVPFTVCQAKDAMLQIIEWQFLSRDASASESSPQSDVGWLEDDEPEPTPTDCWAQGSVPKKVVRGLTPNSVISEEVEPAAEETELDKVETTVQQTEETHDIDIDTAGEVQDVEDGGDGRREKIPLPPKEPHSIQKCGSQTQFKPYTGRLRSAGVTRMTESLEDTERLLLQEADAPSLDAKTPDNAQMLMPASCHSMLKLQAGRPPGQNDVMFDDTGRVISMFRVNPDKLPGHRVKTRFKVVDPEVEAAQARLKAMRTGKYLADRKVPGPTDSKVTGSIYNNSTSPSHVTISGSKPSKPYGVIPIAPPMIETVSVASGVVIKEGDQIRIGSRHIDKNSFHNISQNDLKPVHSKVMLPSLTVAELLEHRTPVVKPLTGNVPIPPIPQQVE